MKKAWHKIHPNFKLNGQYRSREGLWDVGYSLVKEGESYEIDIGEFLIDWLSDSDKVQVKSSGTTGKPKTIFLLKQHMINSALATGNYFALQPGQSTLLCLPTKYISGKMMIVRAMVLGLELHYTEPSSLPLDGLDSDYDFAAMVPLQVQNSIEGIGTIKTLLVGGAKITSELANALVSKPTKIFETYGMTETATHIAVKKIAPNVNAFETLPDVTITKDSRDCLVITAPRLGIHDMATNDLVEILDDNHFKLLGRSDNIINSGGVKLIPEQIESKLSGLIPNPFFVTGVSDKALGAKMILVVEGKTDTNSILQKIKTLKSLSKYEVPKAIYKVDKFILTESGKIQRKKTLQLLEL